MWHAAAVGRPHLQCAVAEAILQEQQPYRQRQTSTDISSGSQDGMAASSSPDAPYRINGLGGCAASVDMYALNARTPPQSPDAHLTYIKHRANGEVMGKSLIDYIITTPDVAMPSKCCCWGPSATVGRQLVSSDHMPVLATLKGQSGAQCERFSHMVCLSFKLCTGSVP